MKHTFFFSTASLLVLVHCTNTVLRTSGFQGDLLEPDAGVTPTEVGHDTSIVFDPEADQDHDGYKAKDDCNDFDDQINPGAFEVEGDHVDNNCNGQVDEPMHKCDSDFNFDITGLYASNKASDYLQALGLCQFTSANAQGKERTWGVVQGSAKFTTTQADDGVEPEGVQHSIQRAWGPVEPREGGSLVALSTGVAQLPTQYGFRSNFGQNPSLIGSVPPKGWPRATPPCKPPEQDMVYNPVVLRAKIRVPTNARAFSFDFSFYTTEYADFVCSAYNDSFVAMLTTRAPLPLEQQGNIVFDGEGNPVNVNSTLFEICDPGDIYVGEELYRTYKCSEHQFSLRETGFWLKIPNRLATGGATGWLRTTAQVVPGEEIEIAFMLWNSTDSNAQSSVILDRWVWDAQGVKQTSTTRPPQ